MNTLNMALRVLLADESSTIKKVMQLALQDFGVEVKTVPVGVDVVPVAKSFKPNIIFADVLLAKKTGYEVCFEIKSDPMLAKVPVVLMWSGFMEIDEGRVQSSRADQRLEKPFDAETLRNLVRNLVPHLQTNQISQFLSFPDMPEWVDDQSQQKKPGALTTAPPPPPQRPQTQSTNQVPSQGSPQSKAPTVRPPPPPPPPSHFSPPNLIVENVNISPPQFPLNEEVEEADEFQAVPLPKNRKAPQSDLELNDQWSREKINQFQVHPDTAIGSQDVLEFEEIQVPLPEDLGGGNFDSPIASQNFQPIHQTDPHYVPPADVNQFAQIASNVDPSLVEQIIREQAREVLTDIAWKILPDIAERIVREELQKLLKEAENLT